MSKLPFGRENYKWMIIGLLIITTGFVIMSLDTQPHGFGFLGITLSPIVVVAGFVVEIYAILHTPRNKENK
jgi:ABC-type transport system involved in cytochrome c biogenesis permease subunit